MFKQLLFPVADSIGLSFCVALLPVVAVLLLLGVFRRPAWQASAAGLGVGLVIAVSVWKMPADMALSSVANGAVFALWPVMWIVINALLLYNITVTSGRFDAFRNWIVGNIPNDRRIVLILVGFCFGALLEGIAGFGAPVAITSSLLILIGLPPMEALVFVLIFNTAPVAFGALGTPVAILGAVTGLPAKTLGAMIGRHLPLMALLLPFYVMTLYGGLRSIKALWPLLLVAGGSFAACQFLTSNFLDYSLTDVFSSLGSLIVTLSFLRVWKPKVDEAFVIAGPKIIGDEATPSAWQGWLPWVIVTAVVVAWTLFKIPALYQQAVNWPHLHKLISITLYNDKPYAAVWSFQPLGGGTAILVSAILTALTAGVGPKAFVGALVTTLKQAWLAIITVMLIIGLAYLMNYSGMSYSLGKGVASTGAFFVILSPFIGWVAVMLSGSDSSGNALFGNLQVVAARQLNLNPILFAASNSSGGVLGKMISPQNISTGVSVVGMSGKEGEVFARTFIHSVILTIVLGLLIAAQQYLVPWMIPLLPPGH